MGVWERIRTNLADIRYFGPAILARHAGRLSADKAATLSVPQFGKVHVRAGESDIAAVRQVFRDKEYDLSWPPEVAARIRSRYDAILAAEQTPLVIDAGANIGTASLWFGNLYPRAAVVAVEPDKDNAAVLRKNIAHRPGHVILEAAIGSRAGHVEVVKEGLGWAVQTKRSDSGLAIVTIDDAVKAAGGAVPFICKIDIEGFEKDLFAENLDWIADFYMIVIEPHDWMLPGQLTSHNFQKALAQYPFEMFMRGENIFYVRV